MLLMSSLIGKKVPTEVWTRRSFPSLMYLPVIVSSLVGFFHLASMLKDRM